MNQAIELLTGAPIIILVIGFLLLFLMAFFLVIFMVRAAVLAIRLRKVAASLAAITKPKEQALKLVFGVDTTLAHLWNEYADTLHRQQDFSTEGRHPVDILRSTVPATTIFTTDAIVDSRLWTEFFKHMPGICTGLGIIGTFYGLIGGLQAFQVSPDPDIVRSGLEGLIHRVGDAFVVSAIAIGLAMATTVIERLFTTVLFKRVEEITTRLDGFFTSGAGEEYLARLTRASEDSAAQSKILKDALVGDLERILTTLTERQIAAQWTGVQTLSQDLTKSITATLAGPLDALAQSARQNAEGNSEAVTRLLTDVLAGFSQRMEDLFGGQIVGINKLQQQTIDALGAAVAKLNQMATAVEEAGTKSVDALNERLLAALREMEAQRKATNDRMAEFIHQMQSAVDQSHTETNRKLQETLSQLGAAIEDQMAALREQGKRSAEAQAERDGIATARTDEMLRTLSVRVDEVLGTMKGHADRSAEAQVEREQQLAALTSDTVGTLAKVAETLMSEVRAIAAEIRSAVEAMRGATTTAIEKMNGGAETLYIASSEFKAAGQSLSGVFQQSENVSQGLRQASGSITQASMTLQGVVADHATARETLGTMLAEMRGVVESARREAGVTSEAVTRIETASRSLGQAQRQAEEYLAEVSRVLTETHEVYNASLTNTLQTQYSEFYRHLSNATGLLRDAIEELALTVQPSLKQAAE
jgi:hypothetical protein